MQSTTETISRFFVRMTLDDVPAAIRHEAKRILLDTLGCLVGGRASEIAPISDRLALLLGGSVGADGSTLVGCGPTGILSAVYGNARMANALDFDETFPVGTHFASGAVAAALALGESEKASGEAVLRAVIVGYELGARVADYIGSVVQVDDGKVTGFAQVWGVAAPVVLAAMGAAAAIAGLDAEQFATAIGLAVTNAPLPAGALWSSAVDLPNCKYCDAGWCAVAGVFAVLSVKAGVTCSRTALDGAAGLARMCGVETFDEGSLVRDLGNRWLVADVTYKLWPTCRFTHYALSALQRILTEEQLAPEDIREIIVKTGPLAASARFTKPLPVTFSSRSFSYPHMVAMMVRGIAPGPEWLEPRNVTAPETRAISDLTTVIPHPQGADFASAMNGNQIREMPGGILVRTSKGEFEADSKFAIGDPWSEVSRVGDDDLIEKFRRMCGAGGADLVAMIFAIDSASSVRVLMQSLDAAARGGSARPPS